MTDEDSVPELAETPISVLGDLWILGDHRLLGGDATDADAVAKLMAGGRADLVFTDPPYNVDYEGYTEERLKIKGDRMSDADFKKFLERVFRSYRTMVKPGASMYLCHSSSWQREFQNALEAAGFQVRCQIIWAKNTFAWGFGRYKFQHEPMFYCHLAGEKNSWYGDKTQSMLWNEKKPAANRIHPTAKRVELGERALLNSSKAGDAVPSFFAALGAFLATLAFLAVFPFLGAPWARFWATLAFLVAFGFSAAWAVSSIAVFIWMSFDGVSAIT